MQIELTEQERKQAQEGRPVDFIDPLTADAYVLIARAQFDRVRSLLTPAANVADQSRIPEGIRVSQEAFRRALPGLLQQKRYERHWAAYHRDEQIGIAYTGQELQEECFRRGLKEDEFYIGWIAACELIEEEEIGLRWHHYVETNHEDS